ncbi:GNAT family N-acetyltransferase [Paenibacillus sp. CC-CFT747]|nr:GNAT family N-acetyltransferase [Paenibacillus sp. CC-CFT747]
MNQIIVRKAEINDVVGLSKLFVDFIGKESNLSAMKEQLKMISDNDSYYVAVACHGNEVIGTATGIVCHDLVGDCNPFMLVENVVVSPTYQRKGAGKILMKNLEDFGEKKRCKYAILVSEIQREISHRFYEAIGYSTDQKGFKKG